MKLIAGAFIVLLCATVSLIMGFKHISAKTCFTRQSPHHAGGNITPAAIGDIPLPDGFKREAAAPGSFAEWLRNIKLRKNNIVYLYNGQPVERQDLHYAVLDISTGNKDLQQCADAIMRLRAEYYFSKKEYTKITFPGGHNNNYNFNEYAKQHNCWSHDCLLQFMEIVFINCGTYTVDDMTTHVNLQNLQTGDVFVKAGAPGHAMIVADAAKNKAGDKIYLLAQSYMPAQDMHIVINPASRILSPWYKVNENEKVLTPGWVFESTQLKRWK
ncbi:MAG TPA: DUF4846 domain-containing protein [Chitinophagaceae bacterium]|nr:DUF4846 domain-containing protein [Chitinophagaceae bacterium]